jgi:O-antigen ligase
MERIDCWHEGLAIWREHPLIGVGLGQFGQYHYKTAHNSYLLALAELGFIGMTLFAVILYMSVKIPVSALSHISTHRNEIVQGGVRLVRAWSLALIAAFAGLAVGIFFLSFTYHYVLWIYLGLSGAFYSALRRHDPSFRVRLSVLELCLIALGNCAMIIAIYLATKWMLS